MLMMQTTSGDMQMEKKKSNGLLRHAVDSPQWKKIDSLFPEFESDPRNLRLDLATNGMNPHGNLSSKHSS